MTNNGIVLNYHDSLLRHSDVQLLDDNYWLNDNIIGFVFEYYEYEKYDKYSKELLFVNPSMVQLLKFSEEEYITSLTDCWDWSTKKLIFIPLNNNSSSTNSGGSHWSLLVINMEQSMCYSYDSSQNFNSEAALHFFKLINKAITSKGHKALKLVDGHCPQQTNSSDCGIYVICIVDDICRRYATNPATSKHLNMRSDIEPQDAKNQRKIIKDLIKRLASKS